MTARLGDALKKTISAQNELADLRFKLVLNNIRWWDM